MYAEIILKTMIVVSLCLSFIFIWINGDPDDYTFITGIMEEVESPEPKNKVDLETNKN
jgi:hypothetical protein